MDRRDYEARVVDDGTLDTVIRVRNCVTRKIHEFRYDSELFTEHSSSGLVVIRDRDNDILGVDKK